MSVGTRRFRPLLRGDGVELMWLLLISAIAAVLVTRFFLAAAGYPQLGGSGLHIAHVLWGGLLMLAGALLLLGALGGTALRVGAVLSGVGFGLFIDEVGKFITTDVDYFFQPAIAIIYVVFVALALALGALARHSHPGPRANLANALALADDAIHSPRGSGARRAALAHLDGADPTDTLAVELRRRISAAAPAGPERPERATALAEALERRYRRLVLHPWFQRGLIAWFAIVALGTTSTAIGIAIGPGDALAGSPSLAVTLQVASSILAGALIVVGILRLPRSRLRAYRWFERAMLVSILITQVFNFYEAQLTAVAGLAVNLAIYAALRYGITHEERRADDTPESEPLPA